MTVGHADGRSCAIRIFVGKKAFWGISPRLSVGLRPSGPSLSQLSRSSPLALLGPHFLVLSSARFPETSSSRCCHAQNISYSCCKSGLGSESLPDVFPPDFVYAGRSRSSSEQSPGSSALSLSHQRDGGLGQHLCVSSDAQSSTKSSPSTGSSYQPVPSDPKRVG